MVDRHPDLHDKIVSEWKVANGHKQPRIKLGSLAIAGKFMRSFSKLRSDTVDFECNYGEFNVKGDIG